MNLSAWYAELRRRRVFRAVLGYGIASFAILQVVEPVMHGLHLPDVVLSIVVVLLGLGFPVAVLLAWAFDLKASGIERTRPLQGDAVAGACTPGLGPKGNRTAVTVALVALGLAIAAPGLTWFFILRAGAQASPPPVAATGGPSVAVLPFADLSPGRDQQYLADGFAEEILDELARIDGLRVAGRTSSFWFKGKDARLPEIGRDLRVRTVLEGSVRREGNRLRISAKLVDVGNGYQLWSEAFDREATDVLGIQGEIARAVAAALQVRLVPPRDPSPSPARKTEPAAYFEYLVGREKLRRGSLADAHQALASFEKVLAMDPGYAPAWAGVSQAAILIADFSGAPEDHGMESKALEAANRAIALAPSLGDGYLARGEIRRDFAFDWEGSMADYERAYSLSPANPAVLVSYAFLLAVIGRVAEARTLAQRATDTDPLEPNAWVTLGVVHHLSGDPRGAEAAARRALEVSPDQAFATVLLHFVLAAAGRGEEALALPMPPSMEWLRLTVTAIARHDRGDAKGARDALAQLVAGHSATAACQVAQVNSHLGDRDAAFAWLAQARAQRDAGLTYARGDPLLRPLHDDPRWSAFLREMKFPRE